MLSAESSELEQTHRQDLTRSSTAAGLRASSGETPRTVSECTQVLGKRHSSKPRSRSCSEDADRERPRVGLNFELVAEDLAWCFED